jgi:hypothetical protein
MKKHEKGPKKEKKENHLLLMQWSLLCCTPSPKGLRYGKLQSSGL